ncbi:MAG TPA: phage tail protein [Symbiobacteriaceae bacterium]|nr:phage tail protein [Symbiobacteriaceae bacterium]
MLRWTRIVLMVFALVLVLQTAGVAALSPGSYTAGRYGLELDGTFAGWLSSAEGGHAVADVVMEQLGPDRIVRKHIGAVKYEDITVTFGADMARSVYQWIQDTLDHKYTRKNGAIIAADYNGMVVSRMEFTNALMTEIGMPALDAASKDAAKMTIKFSPEYTRRTKAQGGTVKATAPADKQKQWLPSNFRLRIDGLESATARVNKIDALVIKQKVTENPVGESRDYQQEPAYLEVPNLVITLAESDSDPLYDWFNASVIQGNNTERSGTLEYLSADMREVLFRVNFQGLGIFKLAPDKMEAGADQIRRVKAEMYCEDIRFTFGK